MFKSKCSSSLFLPPIFWQSRAAFVPLFFLSPTPAGGSRNWIISPFESFPLIPVLMRWEEERNRYRELSFYWKSFLGIRHLYVVRAWVCDVELERNGTHRGWRVFLRPRRRMLSGESFSLDVCIQRNIWREMCIGVDLHIRCTSTTRR